MAYVDFKFVWDGRFASLKPATKAVLHVITALADYETGRFYHSIDTLSQKAGVSYSSAQRAIRKLANLGVVQNDHVPGRPSLRTYLPATDKKCLTPRSRVTDTPVTGDRSTPVTGDRLTTDPQQQKKTTTAADRISKLLIKQMIAQYGAERVVPVVVAMRSFNGEVLNADAYFRTCVERGWIPTSKQARQREEATRRRELAKEREEAQDREWQEHVAMVHQEEDDPEIQERIRREMDKINAILEDDDLDEI